MYVMDAASTFIQYLLSGTLYGFLYALAASGLSLLYGVLDIINFAHGEFLMLGAYFALFFVYLIQLDFITGVILAIVVMGAIGLLFNRTIFTPAVKISWQAPLLATLGLSLALKNTVLLVFGPLQKAIPSPYVNMIVEFAGIRTNALYIAIALITVGTFAFLNLFITRTKMGKSIRAISQNKELCNVLGMNVVKVFDVTVIISLVLACLAGSLYGANFAANINMGTILGLKIFSIVVISGFKNVKGAIVVALVAGIIESMVAGYSPIAGIKDLVLFSAAIVIAILRPSGLFGKKGDVW